MLDTGRKVTDLTATQIATLRNRGFLGIDGDKDAWSLTIEEFSELGSMLLGSGGPITLTCPGAKFAALDMQTLRTKGVELSMRSTMR